MKTFTTLCLFISFFISAQAQIPFEPGWLVAKDNDTLHGEIYRQTSVEDQEVILFRIPGAKEFAHFSWYDVHSYGIKDKGIFKPLEVTRSHFDSVGIHVFAQCLFSGEISLYEYVSPAKLKSRYFADSPDYGLTEIATKPQDRVVRPHMSTGTTIFYSDEMMELFRNLQKVFWRCPRVRDQVPSTENMSRKKLMTLFEAYHLCVDKPYEVIGYRKANSGRIHTGIKGGINLVLNAKTLLGFTGSNTSELKATAQPQFTAFVEYPFPNMDNKFSVIGEVGYTKHFWYQVFNGSSTAYQIQYAHASVLGQRNNFYPWGRLFSNIGLDVPFSSSEQGQRTIDNQTVNFLQPPSFNLFISGGMGFRMGKIGLLILESRVHLTSWQYIRFQLGFRF